MYFGVDKEQVLYVGTNKGKKRYERDIVMSNVLKREHGIFHIERTPVHSIA